VLPALDHYHNTVKRALVKDGWRITDDPYTVAVPGRFLYIDLRAEKASARLSILIEIKGFEGQAKVEALALAVGKYTLYQTALKIADIADPLYLAIPRAAFNGIISEPLGRQYVEHHNVQLLVFDPETEEIIQWTV
jgi:hypothetical protein